MSIWDKMNDLTKGKVTQLEKEITESKVAKHGSIIRGTITNVLKGDESKDKKGGYGFISSPELPYERIFFHWSGLQQQTLRFPELKKRMRVEFQLQYNEYDGFRAIKIMVLK